MLALILGVILAIDSDRYEIWNGWIIAAIVLWALMGAIGQRTGDYYTAVQKLAEEGGDGAAPGGAGQAARARPARCSTSEPSSSSCSYSST